MEINTHKESATADDQEVVLNGNVQEPPTVEDCYMLANCSEDVEYQQLSTLGLSETGCTSGRCV